MYQNRLLANLNFNQIPAIPNIPSMGTPFGPGGTGGSIQDQVNANLHNSGIGTGSSVDLNGNFHWNHSPNGGFPYPHESSP